MSALARWWQLALLWLAVPLALLAAILLEARRRHGETFFLVPIIPWAPSSWPRGIAWLWANGFGYLAAALAVAPPGALLVTLAVAIAKARARGGTQRAPAA